MDVDDVLLFVFRGTPIRFNDNFLSFKEEQKRNSPHLPSRIGPFGWWKIIGSRQHSRPEIKSIDKNQTSFPRVCPAAHSSTGGEKSMKLHNVVVALVLVISFLPV